MSDTLWIHLCGGKVTFVPAFCGCGGPHWSGKDFPADFVSAVNKALYSAPEEVILLARCGVFARTNEGATLSGTE